MIAVTGDSVLVVDPASRRISLVHASGVVRPARLPDDVEMLHPLVRRNDGTLLAYTSQRNFGADTGRDTVDVIVVPRDSASSRVARLPGESREYARGFGATPILAAATDGFWYGSGDTYEIGRYDLHGRLVRITRIPYTPAPVTSEMIARLKERDAETGAHLGVEPRDRPVPQRLPPYVGALPDTEGNLWVRPYGGVRAIWNVFNSEGHYLGDVELPDGFIPFQIGSDYILSRAMDEYNVEYVRLYRLLKGDRRN